MRLDSGKHFWSQCVSMVRALPESSTAPVTILFWVYLLYIEELR